MTDFYITYHGSIIFQDDWIILPKDKTVKLYNVPGYIYCTHLDFHSEKIQEIEPILTFKTGDLIFNPTFSIDPTEIEQANEKKHCRNRIANTTGIYKPDPYIDFYRSCVHPLVQIVQTNAFTLHYIINNLHDVNTIHIYTCLPFEDEPKCALPFEINQDWGLNYYETRRIAKVNNKEFSLIENNVGLSNNFESNQDFYEWLKDNNTDIEAYLSFINFENTNQFQIIEISSSGNSDEIFDIFEKSILPPAPHGNLVYFPIKNLLNYFYKFYVLILFKNELKYEQRRGGIYDSIFDREITNTEEIIESFKPINILEQIERNPNLEINRKIKNKIENNNKIKFSNEDICEFFEKNF